MFQNVQSNVHFPALETEILRFWDDHAIYEKSLDQRRDAPKFVFFEGPPTANGLPHPGHCLTRAIKDLFPRYRTMRGFRCERKAGWDTHGLPVEVEVCKELGIHAKDEIESFGVEPFIHRCMDSVFRYTRQWEELTRRLGFWINLDEAYVTYHQSYVESVWWALKTLFDRDLLYQGHKIVWWWAQGGTALSSGEVGLGYREVADPSVYVRFPLLNDDGSVSDTDLLVWTTTPWTLPANQFAAVHPDLEYSVVRDEELGRRLVIASALVETIAGKVKRKLHVEYTCLGQDPRLAGKRYVPPFDFFYKKLGNATEPLAGTDREKHGAIPIAWRVVTASFVTTDSGTGVVHEAPAFGEVDYELLLKQQQQFAWGAGPQLICPVGPDGKFTRDVPPYAGRWVKDCDKDIIRDMRQRGILYHQEQYLHEYPFCWRADDDPLIQYPRRSWFIRTSQFKQQMLANNARINWLPEHIRDGRFGNFLETNVDWALSRERYWGTPLPIWVCDNRDPSTHCPSEAIASYAELQSKPGVQGLEVWERAKAAHPSLAEHLKVHKPYIDAVTYACPYCKTGRMRRVPDVIDCWFDSGAMPFAQWGYRGENGPREARHRLHDQFPADFISEALDQTRGWFYSLLAISTLLFGPKEADSEHAQPGAADPPTQEPPAAPAGAPALQKQSAGSSSPHTLTVPYPHPFKNCIVLGLMLTEWWEGKQTKKVYLSEDEALAAEGPGNFEKRVGKMSKSLRNYREPNEIFDRYGADALRWYFFANQAPWTAIRYSEQSIKESIPEFLLRLWNVYSFFVNYAIIDGFDPGEALPHLPGKPHLQLTSAELAKAQGYVPLGQRSELDRWIVSELNRTAAGVVERMDAYDNYAAARLLHEFVDALSNWYVRRSRDRFWSGEASADKRSAHWTLYECLLTTCKLIAPFTPFVAEAMWRNLACAALGQRAVASVHLCDFPTGDPAAVDEQLSIRMNLVREIVSLGRAARTNARLKVRQPLADVEVVLADTQYVSWLEEHAALIADELNVKHVGFTTHAEEYITYTVLPNLPRLGPRLGKRLPALRQALAQADPAALLRQLDSAGSVTFDLPGEAVMLDRQDIQVRLQAQPGWAAAQGAQCAVVLNTELTPELVLEGLARDLVRVIQDRRKEIGCSYTDRIRIGLVTHDAELLKALAQFADYIRGETLAVELVPAPLPGGQGIAIPAHEATLYIHVVRPH